MGSQRRLVEFDLASLYIFASPIRFAPADGWRCADDRPGGGAAWSERVGRDGAVRACPVGAALVGEPPSSGATEEDQ